MRKLRASACAFFGACLVSALMVPASASHQPRQTIPGAERVSHVFVGLDDDGTATAVWNNALGTMAYSSRLANGRFGPALPVPGTVRVNERDFDEASNGNAIVATIDSSEALSQIRASVKLGGGSGFRSHQVVSEITAQNVYGLATATSESGRSVIVWVELISGGGTQIRAALSNTSGVFGAPVTVASGPVDFPHVDMGADGSALLVWDRTDSAQEAVMAADAPAGQAFGAERVIENLDQGAGEPQVAVNASNQAVIAYGDATPDPCPVDSCAPFWTEVKLGSVGGAFGPAQGVPPNQESGYSAGTHEVAMDDSGKAAVLLSISTPDPVGYAIVARVSDVGGTFGPVQTISPEDQVFGPGVAQWEMELAAGGGEFSAVWTNDHNADGQTNEIYMSSTTNSTFSAPDQLSDPSTGFLNTYVARNASGASVAAWTSSDTELLWASPVVLSGPAALFGTNLADRVGGTASADVARMGAGNDRFTGKGGNDRISGEAGNDFLDGGSGANVLNGGPGRDTCVKRSRRDRLQSCEVVRRP